jgi:starch-binding outer membrane protein, SusD/RagB family
MKKRQLNILNLGLLSALILMLLPRCVKLEEKPLDFTNPDNFYKSISQIESAFASSLQRLFSPWSAYGYTYFNFQDDDQYDYGELVIEDNHASDLWANHYQSIADLNPAIKALNEDRLGSLVSQDVKDELMAQAKFVRAFNYFSLVRLWGPVPLITENTDLTPEIIGPSQVSRSPISDVYALIESDLLFAIDKLPEVWPPERKGRPSKDAARALLAKVYITMATNPMNDAAQYVKARDMAKQVIEAGNHYLEHNVEDVFKLENAYGPEMIWSFNCSPDDPMTEPQIWLPGSMADGWGDIHPDVIWAAKYPVQPRRDAYLQLENWDGVPAADDPGFWWGGPGIKKFIYESRENIERLYSAQNYPILRFADVLLLFAEAENEVNNGPNQAAVDAVNQIIDRANGYVDNPAEPKLTTALSKDAFDSAVINERNLELCFEYDRWYDLCRKRILREMTVPEFQQNFSEDDYLWPIPLSDMRINPLLTQNPGYATP